MVSPAKTPALPRDAGPTSAVTRRKRRRPEQQTLSLPPVETLAPAADLPRAARTGQLWLCLYLPLLPLEAIPGDASTPFRAVFEEQRGLRRILQATPAAGAAGIHAGLSVNAALALEPELQLDERKPEREQRVLSHLAGRAERYTSLVVVEAPAALLLEIAASLRLFGGLVAMCKQVLRDIEAQGFTVQPAIAPTPLAATWLARAGSRRNIRRLDTLAGALSTLPVHCLAWPATVTASLQGMGITAVGDCLRLPRAGFTRRFGAARLLQLDRALGRLPDPRESHRTPKRFCEDCELYEEQSDSEPLLSVCEQLLQKLTHFLLTRQRAIQCLQFLFYHLQGPATPLTLGSVQAERDTERWMALLRLRFERVALPAPVIAIRLRGGRAQPLTAKSAALGFEATRRQSAPAAHLIERLGARLGADAVHGIGTVAEYRPEQAWQTRSAVDTAPYRPDPSNPWYERRAPQVLADMRRSRRLLLPRPLWMLDEPERLTCRGEHPCYEGPLTLKTGPERIETGWWDEGGIARDYYVALNPAGVQLWVFRHRGSAGGWYLHGIFG